MSRPENDFTRFTSGQFPVHFRSTFRSKAVNTPIKGMVWHKDRKEKPNPTNLLKQYAIPKADQSEILIEKTPEIMNGNYKQLKQRAIIMKSIMPHVKFLGMILTSAQILVH